MGNTILPMAIAAGHVNLVKALFAQKLPFTQAEKNEAMHQAAKWGNLQMSDELLQQGTPVNAKFYQDDTPLMTAASQGQLEMIRHLIAQGANIHELNNAGESLLIIAARKGQTEVSRFLLEQGLDPHLPSQAGETALSQAALFGNPDTLKLLLDQGAKLESRNLLGETPLMNASKSLNVENLKFLLSEGANIYERDEKGQTALMHAVLRSTLENVQVLLEKGAILHIKDSNGLTALDHAYKNGKEVLFQYLSVKMGLPSRKFNLQDVVNIGKVYMLNDLIIKGADPNQIVLWKGVESAYEAPLVFWVISQSDSIFYLEELLAHGVNFNGAFDHEKKTALHWAAQNTHPEIAAYVLKQG